MGARELGRVETAHNAIAVRIDASQLARVAALPGVQRVRPVIHYSLNLEQTVPYVGGGAAGSGLRWHRRAGRRARLGHRLHAQEPGRPGIQAVYNECFAQRAVAPSGACAA
jgi:hypothetical protein